MRRSDSSRFVGGSKRSLRPVLAILPPIVALIVQWSLWSLIDPYAWFLFYPAVFISSWIGGLRAGLVATVIATASVLWFFVPPQYSFVKAPIFYFPASVFTTMGVLFGVFHDRLRKANQRTADALGASERANERLKQAVNERRMFAALIENSSDFIGIADAKGKPIYVNPAGRRMVGLAADQPVDDTQMLEYYPSDQRSFASNVILASMFESGHWQGETYFRHWQTQAAIPVSDTHFMIRDPETSQLLGMGTVTRDISDLRRARDELQRANAEVTRLYEKSKELDDLKTQFFANVSHELRTPLALILGPTERLLESPDISKSARRDLEVVARNARTLLGHVDNLLDIAKLEASGLEPKYVETDLSWLTRFVAGHFEALAKDKRTTFEVEGPDVLIAQIDPEKVQRILLNLLSNAFKFTPSGGHIRLSLREAGERAFIEVADSGPGVPPDQREAVFERFRQLEGGATRRLGGTGLGLSIARDFAVMHGGSIAISEAPEGGALFVVELPRTAPPGVVVRSKPERPAEVPTEVRNVLDALRAESGAVTPVSTAAKGALVLVVEDNPEMSRFIADALSDQYRVAAVFDGKEGLEKARALRPDLILSDIMMPEMSGDELVLAVRRCPELDATPIVLLTAKADDELRVRLLREGAQDYLTKPFSVAELRARVANLVNKKRAEELLRQAEAKFRGIVALAADAIVSIDDEQRIVLYNEGAEQIFGWSREEVLGKPLDILLSPGVRERHRDYVHDFAAAEATARKMGETRPVILARRKNGEEFPVQAAISKLELGGAWVLTAIIRDITEHKRIEKEEKFLAEVGAALSSTLDYEETVARIARLAVRELGDWCVVDILEDDGQLRSLASASADPAKSDIAEALERCSLDPACPHLSWTILKSKQPQVMSEVSTEMLPAIAQSEEHRRLLEAIGAKSVMGVPLVAHGRMLGALVVASSHPERRYSSSDIPLLEALGLRAALALENARLYRSAQQAIQARDDVLGIVAHDLRNPLGTILMQATLLRRRAEQLEPTLRKSAEVIERAATRMNRLIQDLLDVARMEGGRLVIEPARLPAEQIVADALEAQKPLAASASLDLLVDMAPDLPEVWADRDRLLQVFENLIGNALKFTPSGGRITIGAARRDGEVLFWVADTGPGISAEELSHLFDHFWQARRAGKRGGGLGLLIVKGIVEAHFGRVWVESTPGRGSTFSFTIPTAGRGEELECKLG